MMFQMQVSVNFWVNMSDLPQQVDGFNVEISITHSKDCPQPSCSVDINASCPPELQVTGDNGEVAGCMTACSAGVSVLLSKA